jgi:hypothetical protein
LCVHPDMSLIFSSISQTEVIRLLRPHELAAMIRNKYDEAKKKAEEEAEVLNEALQEVGEKEKESVLDEDGGSDSTDGVSSGKTDAYAPTPEEVLLMNERACNNPAEEAERRSAIISSIIFGKDTQLSSEFGDDEERTAVLIEFLLGSIHFAQISKFTDEQVSVVFAIAERLFSFSRSPKVNANEEQKVEQKESKTITGTKSRHKWAPRTESYAAFANMLRRHAVPDKETNKRLFNATSVEQITDFFSTTFFRHYKAYEYAFTVERRTKTSVVNVAVAGPLEIPPLSQAKEIIMTAAEKKALAEEEEQLKKAAAKQMSEDDGQSSSIVSNSESKDDSGNKMVSEENIKKEEETKLDDRMLRAINERVNAETAMLNDQLKDLKEIATS